MKILRYTYLIVSAVVTAVMAACSSDSDTPEHLQSNEETVLHLRITSGQSGREMTRARTTNWSDTNAQDEEMMNLWVVVVTNTSDGSVEKCFACRPTAGVEREIDEVGQITKGAYTVYSFANISVASVCSLLGLTAPATIPTIDSTPIEIAVIGTVSNAANKVATINGNGFNPTATDNGFGETGIPMSNVQTISDNETDKDLIVIRMLAKIEILLYNETGNVVTLQSVTLSDLTNNPMGGDDPDNLMLLPSLSSPDDLEAHHKDVQPNLNGTPATTDYTYMVPTNLQTVATAAYASGIPAQKLTFYVNESATPSNPDGLFYLTLKLANGSTSELRYALVSNNSDNEWNYIARNDYRIIPIVIDDYKLELIPYDFPPIGVYPCSVKEIENDLYEMTFHDYGHFHLVPKVSKISTSDVVPFGYAEGTNPYWTLNTDFAGSWKTAATKGGAWLDASGITTNGFYRNQTTTTDGDDAGGAPVWYANTSSPQWNPTGGSNYNPFIFGYIADPGDTWWAQSASDRSDKQIYHEFRVKLYVDGNYRRDLLYRFYMILSKDQVLGARRFTPLPSEGWGGIHCPTSFSRQHKMTYNYDE